MEQTILPLSFIRLLYKETNAEETAQLNHQLQTSPLMTKQFQQYQDIKDCLSQEKKYPRKDTLHRVLDYARDKN